MPELPPANWGEGFSASGVVLNIYKMNTKTFYLEKQEMGRSSILLEQRERKIP